MRVLALCLAVAAGGLGGCQPPSEAPAATGDKKDLRPTKKVRIVSVAPTTFVERIELTASVEAPRDAVLAARTSGEVKSLLALGASVVAGVTVAQIDADGLNAAVVQADGQIAAARAAVKLAADSHGRQQPLVASNIISPLEFSGIEARLTQARATLKQAHAMRRQAKKMAETAVIEAPFDGIIEQRFVELGETVAPGQPVARVVDTREVKIKAGVPERYAADIRVGAAVEVSFNAYGMKTRKAKVTFVGQTINRASRTFPVEILLDNVDRALKPQMIAKVLLSRSSTENALVVPQSAVLHDERGAAVFVTEKSADDEIAKMLRVKTGGSSDGKVLILEGLEAGAQLVVYGHNQLTTGELLELVQDSVQGSAKDSAQDPAQ